jgi:hypothetical protein
MHFASVIGEIRASGGSVTADRRQLTDPRGTGLNIVTFESLRVCVSKSFRTGRLERELQMVQLSATRCSFIAIL